MTTIGNEFSGLPMSALIGGPLDADAQAKLANATANFIRTIGFLPPADGAEPGAVGDVRLAKFQFQRPAQATPGEVLPAGATEMVELDVPLLALVNVPSLSVKTVDIIFDMEVKSSETDRSETTKEGQFSAAVKAGWGPVSVRASISGKVSTHREQTRSTDKSAKYHVEVHARDDGMPEGLARVLDILNQSVAPSRVERLPPPAVGPGGAPGTGTNPSSPPGP